MMEADQGAFYDEATPAEPPRTGMATASLVLGIVSLPTLCVCVGPLVGLVAVILGGISAYRVSSRPGRFGGRGRAIGGIVTGGISVLLALVALSQLPRAVRETRPVMNLSYVAMALQEYQAQQMAYPPDLETLVAENGPLPQAAGGGVSGTPFDGVYYVQGVQPTDPADWVLAFARADILGYQMAMVARPTINSQPMVEPVPVEQLDAILEGFKREFEADRGHPPEIEAPPGVVFDARAEESESE
jgi:hypothetical protein